MDIRVNLDNASVITRAFAQAPAMVLDELETAIEQGLNAYLVATEQVMHERKVNASGNLRRSFYVDVQAITQLDAVFGRLINPLPYALPVELGTKPHWAPYEPILNWVEQKLNLYGDEAEAAARGIQRKIANVGTPGRGMLHQGVIDAAPNVQFELEQAAQRIQSRLAAMGGSAGAGA